MTFDDFLNEWHSGTEYIKAQTSGSTGRPGRILLPRKMMIESAKRTISFFRLDSSTHFHSCVAADFIGGKMMAVRADILGAPFTYEPPSNHPVIVSSGKVPDFIALVPSQLWGIIKILQNPEIEVSLREKLRDSIFLAGGGELHPDLAEACRVEGLKVYESYGMTETSSHIALRKVGERMFRPLEGIAVRKDERDCLAITLPGYDELATNDLVEIEPDNSFRIIGRLDNVIVSGGRKINPEHIERTLLPLLRKEGVKDIMAIGNPHPIWGRELHLLIEKPEYDPENKPEDENLIPRIMEISRERLNPWEVAKQIKIVDTLPRTANGKLKRNV